jgi:hypothetical protein
VQVKIPVAGRIVREGGSARDDAGADQKKKAMHEFTPLLKDLRYRKTGEVSHASHAAWVSHSQIGCKNLVKLP